MEGSMLLAITRDVSQAIVNCELTHLARVPIDVDRARRQHAQYEVALKRLGAAVLSLPEQPELADSVFVEDTALVLDECAIILRPGAESRRPETESIRHVLMLYRQLFQIEAPARVDGGDLLRLGKDIFMGISTRSDTNAAEQLQEILKPFDYELHLVPVTGCLHLKSAVTQLRDDTLLINPVWVDKSYFGRVKFLEIAASESYAANALLLGGAVIFPVAFPRTRKRIEDAGIEVRTVEADELAKAEGAVTCCSLILET
jgi:dimethylargininase